MSRRILLFVVATCLGLTAYFIHNQRTIEHEADKPTIPAQAIPLSTAGSFNESQPPTKDPSPMPNSSERSTPAAKPDRQAALLTQAGKNLRHVYDNALQSTIASETLDGLIAARECETFVNSDPSSMESDLMATIPESATKPFRLLAAKALIRRCTGFVAQSDSLSSRNILEQRLLTMFPNLRDAKALAAKVLSNVALTDAERSTWCNLVAKASADPFLFYFIEPAIGEDISNALKSNRTVSPAAVNVMRNIIIDHVSCTTKSTCEAYNTEALLACAYFGECSRPSGSYALNPNYSVQIHKKALEFYSRLNVNRREGSCYGSN